MHKLYTRVTPSIMALCGHIGILREKEIERKHIHAHVITRNVALRLQSGVGTLYLTNSRCTPNDTRYSRVSVMLITCIVAGLIHAGGKEMRYGQRVWAKHKWKQEANGFHASLAHVDRREHTWPLGYRRMLTFFFLCFRLI